MAYIGKSMSLNAKSAHERGLMPISEIRKKDLESCGFNYPVVFFKWLCKEGYIAPAEFHHTSAAKKITKFYSPIKIEKFARAANFPYLYDIYRGKMTAREAIEKLNLKYYKIECVGELLGAKGVSSVSCCVIYYKGAYYISEKKKILKRDTSPNTFRIVAEYAKGDERWRNKRARKIERGILMFMSKGRT